MFKCSGICTTRRNHLHLTRLPNVYKLYNKLESLHKWQIYIKITIPYNDRFESLKFSTVIIKKGEIFIKSHGMRLQRKPQGALIIKPILLKMN